MKINNPKALLLSVLTGFTLFVSHANMMSHNQSENQKISSNVSLANSEVTDSKDVTLKTKNDLIGKLTYQANIIHIDRKNKLIDLDGNVEIKVPGFILTTDKIKLTESETIKSFSDNKLTYQSDTVEVDKNNNLVSLDGNVKIKFNNFILTTDKIKIAKDNSFESNLTFKNESENLKNQS